mmetsp:Transcript_87054/g.254726  ORF Transcript_87054/g.254726 Transcript_87054/m.254726 type:complete len:205 (-) Transcript_87054:27-641(-)
MQSRSRCSLRRRTRGARLAGVVAARPGDRLHEQDDVLVVLAVVAIGAADEAHGEGPDDGASAGPGRHREGHRVVVVLRAGGHVVHLADEVHCLLEGPQVGKPHGPLRHGLRRVEAVGAAALEAVVQERCDAEGALRHLEAHVAAGAPATAAVVVLAVRHGARGLPAASAADLRGRSAGESEGKHPEQEHPCLPHDANGKSGVAR